jgi:putative ABC transport system permease protein
MNALAPLKHLLDDLRVQKLRSALTILGITWGTVAVVVLLAFGVGLEANMKKDMHGVGDGIVLVFAGRTTTTYRGFPEGREVSLREEDIALIAREVPEIELISPEYNERSTPVRRGESSATPNITGVIPIYGDMRNIIPAAGGRFLNDLDMTERRRVAVLGDEIAKLLFEEADPVGQEIFIGAVPFTIVGVMVKKSQNSSYNSRDRDRVFIPASTHRAVFGSKQLSNIVYRVGDALESDEAERKLRETMGRRYTFDPEDDEALQVWDTREFDKFIRYFFLGMNIFLGIVGSFTLTVGGIGVANIMYVVVRERTREIGIRRSIGASRGDILRQFLAETFLIVAAGALLGFLISAAIVFGLGLLPITEYVGRATISPFVALATITLLGGIAFFAGLFPARKAANLDPVECLRYGT